MKTKIDATSSTDHFGKQDFEVVKREQLYSGVFTLSRLHLRHRLFNGGWSEVFTRELLERYSAAAVLPYDPILDRVILIEQIRPGSLTDAKTPWLVEIPAGVLVPPDDTYEEVAHHEAEEEAGCSVSDLVPICEYYVSPGGSNEYIKIYCGRVDASHAEGVHGLKHEHEDIRVMNLSYSEAIEKLYRGEVKTSPATSALFWLQTNREMLRQRWRSSSDK